MSFTPPSGIVNVDFKCLPHPLGSTNVNFKDNKCVDPDVGEILAYYGTFSDIKFSERIYVSILSGESTETDISSSTIFFPESNDGSFIECDITLAIKSESYSGEIAEASIFTPITFDPESNDGSFIECDVLVPITLDSESYSGETVEVSVVTPTTMNPESNSGETVEVSVVSAIPFYTESNDGSFIECDVTISQPLIVEIFDGNLVESNITLPIKSESYSGEITEIIFDVVQQLNLELFDGSSVEVNVEEIIQSIEIIIIDGEYNEVDIFLPIRAESNDGVYNEVDVFVFAGVSSRVYEGSYVECDVSLFTAENNKISCVGGEFVSVSIFISAVPVGEISCYYGEVCEFESFANGATLRTHYGEFCDVNIACYQNITIDNIHGEIINSEVKETPPWRVIVDSFDGSNITLSDFEFDDSVHARFIAYTEHQDKVICSINSDDSSCLFTDFQYFHPNRDYDTLYVGTFDIDMRWVEPCDYKAGIIAEKVEVNIACRPKFSALSFNGEYAYDKDPRNLMDTITIYTGEKNRIEFESTLNINTCNGNYELFGGFLVTELNDISDYYCHSNYTSTGEYIECDIHVTPRIFIKLLGTGENAVLETIFGETIIEIYAYDETGVLCPNYVFPASHSGEIAICSIYAPPIYAYDGMSAICKVTFNKALEWVDTGCLDNEFIPAIEETGTLDYDKAVLTTAEFDPYKHEIKLRCINI